MEMQTILNTFKCCCCNKKIKEAYNFLNFNNNTKTHKPIFCYNCYYEINSNIKNLNKKLQKEQLINKFFKTEKTFQRDKTIETLHYLHALAERIYDKYNDDLYLFKIEDKIIQKSLEEKVKEKHEKYKNDFFDPNKQYKTRNLLSNNELTLFKELTKWFNKNYYILPQVSLRSIIETPYYRNTSKELYRTIDFVIFDTDFKPILAIELNGKEHNKDAYTINRDYSNKQILNKAELPLIFIWNEDLKNLKKIQKDIKTKLKEHKQ